MFRNCDIASCEIQTGDMGTPHNRASILYEDRSLLEAGDRLLYLTVNCPNGIPNDVLKESIVHSANEKSDRFLYLAASFKGTGRHFESVQVVDIFSPLYLPPNTYNKTQSYKGLTLNNETNLSGRGRYGKACLIQV